MVTVVMVMTPVVPVPDAHHHLSVCLRNHSAEHHCHYNRREELRQSCHRSFS